MITKQPYEEHPNYHVYKAINFLATASGRELALALSHIDDETLRQAENAIHYTYRDREIQKELENNG
jgi:hypothetical protein